MNHKYRKTVIAANWKMNKTPSETRTFGAELKRLLPKGRWWKRREAQWLWDCWSRR